MKGIIIEMRYLEIPDSTSPGDLDDFGMTKSRSTP